MTHRCQIIFVIVDSGIGYRAVKYNINGGKEKMEQKFPHVGEMERIILLI